jgi:squalene-associated FAD-dependent desaturase
VDRVADVGLGVTQRLAASRKIAVLGGGWSGLAAAVTLADVGARPTLFEAARTLGGRARRVEHEGLALDNGLHILIGAYRETLRLMRRVADAGARDAGLLRLPLDLHIPGCFRLRAAALPAPLHLALGLLQATGLSTAERLGIARFMWRLRTSRFRLEHDIGVGDLLERLHASERTRRYLWEPLCVSALNTPPGEASAQIFLNVLRDSLNGTRADSDLLLPARDLSALFPEPAARAVEAAGGEVRLGCAVDAVHGAGEQFLLRSAAGEERFERVICALPPYRVPQVLAGLPQLQATLDAIGALRHEPIYSVYLQYPPAARLPQPMLGFEGGFAQWAFDRGRLCGQRGLIGVVISARGRHQDIDQAALARSVQAELAARHPELGAPRWSKVIAEKRGTIACTVGMARPGQRTVLPGLYLAGDYTASDYPATLESAVRSGIACARLALDSTH